LLADLTSKQISEWLAYDKLDPIGSWREDYRLAFISSLITNIALRQYGKKEAKLTEVSDFMLIWDEEARRKSKEQTPEEMKEILLNLARGYKPKKMVRKQKET